MNSLLATYLDDHLTGARFALELIASLREQHPGEPLGEFAAGLLSEVESDRDLLQQMAEHIGGGANPIREATAWLAEKASRLKLRFGSDPALGTLEAIETLSMGVLGKRALWRSLFAVQADWPQLADYDFTALAASAEQQFARVEQHRLAAAKRALSTRPS